MSSKKKALKINDDDSMEQPSNATSINLNNGQIYFYIELIIN